MQEIVIYIILIIVTVIGLTCYKNCRNIRKNCDKIINIEEKLHSISSKSTLRDQHGFFEKKPFG